MFFITRMLPGNPALVRLGGIPEPAALEAMEKLMGLDKPLHEQFYIYISELAHGNFGKSFLTGRPVYEDVTERFPATVELGLLSQFMAVIVGFPLGTIAALRRNKIMDHVARLIGVVGVSIPNYYLGLVLTYVLFFHLRLFPAPMGRIGILISPPHHITGLYILDSILTGNLEALSSSLSHIALPAITLSFFAMAPIVRMTRSAMLEIMSSDYVRMARAAGIPEREIIQKDVLKNAMLPLLTILGLSVGTLLGGVVVIESVFSWPGLGSFALSSFQANDYDPIQTYMLISVSAFLATNLVVDILYGIIDPRIKYG